MQGTRATLRIGVLHVSNRPFEYLAWRLALLASDLPYGREMFIRIRFCFWPAIRRIPRALPDKSLWFLEHPVETCSIGAKGAKESSQNGIARNSFLAVLNHLRPGGIQA